MKTAITVSYLLVHLAGAAIFATRYRRTRASVPGIAAFLLLAMVRVYPDAPTHAKGEMMNGETTRSIPVNPEQFASSLNKMSGRKPEARGG